MCFREDALTIKMDTFLCLNFFAFFNDFKHRFTTLELNRKPFDRWSEFAWINWYFMKNLSCVFVSVFVKMHSRKRWTRFFVWFLFLFFLHFQWFQASVHYFRVESKPFDGWCKFALINWYFMKNRSCVFVSVFVKMHSQKRWTRFFEFFFTFFNDFKHRFTTLELNQNHLMDEVNLLGWIDNLWKTLVAFS